MAMRTSTTPGSASRMPGAANRILLADASAVRRAAYRRAIEDAGFGEPECADSGDEALDLLGARAQQFDVVAAWMPLPDDADVDLAGVLRRCNSPVRLLVMTNLGPRDYPRAGRLAGCAGVESKGSEREFIRLVRAIAGTACSVADIVSGRQAPATLADDWSARIYGVPPGARFHGRLD